MIPIPTPRTIMLMMYRLAMFSSPIMMFCKKSISQHSLREKDAKEDTEQRIDNAGCRNGQQ